MSARNSAVAAALLAIVAVLPANLAPAQPRAPPAKWRDPAGPPTPTGLWLQRLVGAYRFDGLIEVVYYPDRRCDSTSSERLCQGVEGKADCVAVGPSSGVQCIFSARWPDLWDLRYPEPGQLEAKTGVFEVPGGVSNLDPSMALFGLDPLAAGLRFLQVDSKGLAEGATGLQGGNRATFIMPCVNSPTLLSRMFPDQIDSRPLHTCQRTLRIDARPDARVVNMSVDFEINDVVFTRYELQLWREYTP